MRMSKAYLLAKHAYIDTSSFKNEGFDWNGPTLSRLEHLVSSEELKLLTTSITKREVYRRLKESMDQVSPKILNSNAVLLRQLKLHDVLSSFGSGEDLEKLCLNFRAFLEKNKAEEVSITNNIELTLDQHFSLLLHLDRVLIKNLKMLSLFKV